MTRGILIATLVGTVLLRFQQAESFPQRKDCCDIDPMEYETFSTMEAANNNVTSKGHVTSKYLVVTCSKKPGYSCFTTNKVAACSKGYKPARTHIRNFQLVCIPSDQRRTEAIKQEVVRGMKPELEGETKEFMLLNLPRKCIPKK